MRPGGSQRSAMTEPTNSPARIESPLRERSLRHAIHDGVFYSLMAGLGESYIGPFAIFLKASTVQIGLLAAVPQVIGSWAQFFSVEILNFLKSRKAVILAGVALQALTWIPLMVLPFVFPDAGILWLTLCATAYYLLGNFATPAWNSLMGDLVPEDRRGAYFAHRNRINSVTTFTGLCLAGAVLHLFQSARIPAAGFWIIFSCAAVFRMFSAYHISRMFEPRYALRNTDNFGIIQFFRQFKTSNYVHFTVYIAAVHFSVFISAPFFALYMLRDLHFTYLEFTAASAVAILSQFITLQYWGKLSDHVGNKKLLEISGLLLPFIPMLWLFTENFVTICLIQVVAGFVWAGFTLSMGNFIFDAVSPGKRAKCVAISNGMNAAGLFFGAVIGGFIDAAPPEIYTAGHMTVSFASNLPALFFISGLMRLVAGLALLKTFKEVRDVAPCTVRELIYRVSAIRPVAGLKFDIFTGDRPENGPEPPGTDRPMDR